MFPPCALVLPRSQKMLEFWERDTGQGVHLAIRYTGAVAFDFLFPYFPPERISDSCKGD